MRNKDGKLFEDTKKGLRGVRSKHKEAGMVGKYFQTKDGVYEVKKSRGMMDGAKVREGEVEKVEKPGEITSERIEKPNKQIKLRF